jgi:hypothetical protein
MLGLELLAIGPAIACVVPDPNPAPTPAGSWTWYVGDNAGLGLHDIQSNWVPEFCIGADLDLHSLITLNTACPIVGDMDGNGAIHDADLLHLIALFGAGCP